ncbi:MAG: pantoate--beta-alanine ligase [bacterium]|nr:pantoate--beta-alanine ligase [bacterium]
MKIIKDPKIMQRIIWNLKSKKKKIGFVPTMGALHEGHLSLVRASRKENDITVVSIFVNPAQFGPHEDYRAYPRSFGPDQKKCKAEHVDFIFYPRAQVMYPAGYATYTYVEGLSEVLCGQKRPGHFKGVATIVLKLLHIIMPDHVYFGMKDYQQYIIIKKMAEDLNLGITVIGLPIIRERIGLAMSSRNAYLTREEKEEATLLSMALFYAKGLVETGEAQGGKVVKSIYRILLSGRIIKPRDIDYISIMDSKTLTELKIVQKPCVIALAVRIGKARLIDNIIL